MATNNKQERTPIEEMKPNIHQILLPFDDVKIFPEKQSSSIKE